MPYIFFLSANREFSPTEVADVLSYFHFGNNSYTILLSLNMEYKEFSRAISYLELSSHLYYLVFLHKCLHIEDFQITHLIKHKITFIQVYSSIGTNTKQFIVCLFNEFKEKRYMLNSCGYLLI